MPETFGLLNEGTGRKREGGLMKLLTPIRIGKLEIKNRIVMPAMHTAYGSEDGQVTERMISYYEERARGGVGLIIVEFTAVERRGRSMPLQLMIESNRFIPGLRRSAEAIKSHGTKAAIQLQHGGVKTSAKITEIQPIALLFSLLTRQEWAPPLAL